MASQWIGRVFRSVGGRAGGQAGGQTGGRAAGRAGGRSGVRVSRRVVSSTALRESQHNGVIILTSRVNGNSTLLNDCQLSTIEVYLSVRASLR